MKTIDSKGAERCSGREEVVKRAADFVKDCTPVRSRVGFILGSGFGGFAAALEKKAVFPVFSLRGFPRPTIDGHSGGLALGLLEGVGAAMFTGRVHLYEGVDVEDALLPVRLLRALGAETLVVTNSAGGVSDRMRTGDLMAIEDHINLTFVSGAATGGRGRVYDQELSAAFVAATAALGVPARAGVYCALRGPSYETPAEIAALRRFGVDAVGMSTVFEACEARRLGMRVLGVSSISNSHAHGCGEPLTHEEVLAATSRAAGGALESLGKMIVDGALAGAAGKGGHK